MRQPQYDAHWIEQFAQISDGVGHCDCTADLDYIMIPFLSNLYTQMCNKFAAIVQQIHMNKGERALDLEVPLRLLCDQSTVIRGGNAVGNKVHLLARDRIPEFGRSLVCKSSARNSHFGRSRIPAKRTC